MWEMSEGCGDLFLKNDEIRQSNGKCWSHEEQRKHVVQGKEGKGKYESMGKIDQKDSENSVRLTESDCCTCHKTGSRGLMKVSRPPLGAESAASSRDNV